MFTSWAQEVQICSIAKLFENKPHNANANEDDRRDQDVEVENQKTS